MVRFAANAIFSFSNLPLKLATMVGLVTTGFGLAGIFYILLMLIAFRVYLPGVSATLFAVLLMGGIQLIFLGVLGEYVGRLFEASKNRPLYVIARSRNVLIPWSSTPPRSHSSAAKT
jgi:dolichol-phosphate mannosyltransferase